jgi:hypothetical protein
MGNIIPPICLSPDARDTRGGYGRRKSTEREHRLGTGVRMSVRRGSSIGRREFLASAADVAAGSATFSALAKPDDTRAQAEHRSQYEARDFNGHCGGHLNQIAFPLGGEDREN